jgi:hypothetical protein
MKELYERGEKIDRLTVANELMKQGQLESVHGLRYLVSLDQGMPELANLDLLVCKTVSMGVRFAVSAALAACVALILLTGSLSRPAQAQLVAPESSRPARASPPPPMFSPWYGESLRDILKLEESDVARLEQKLTANPDDFPTRLKLMAYHQRADRSSHQEDRSKRVRHVLWLIEQHPDSELLHSYVSRFSQGELAPADYRRAVALWDAAAKAKPGDAAVQWNAAAFFQDLDPELHMHYLEATAAADPNHPFSLRLLADFSALSILGRGPLASRAQAGLEASNNVWVLGNAAYMFQSQYNQTLQRGAPNPRAAELAERYFLRAKALDPNLDRQAILPQLDPQGIARALQVERQAQRDWQARAEEAIGKIRRLPVEAFPELPPAVAGVLRARNYRAPQPSAGGAPRNVIRGEFFAKGENGWAVLCSVNNSTALLAFRNDRDTNPDTVTTGADRRYLQGLTGDNIGYSREITAAGRDFIVGHYRAYSGPEPPPIDHHGIDDAFLEKASITWYFHKMVSGCGYRVRTRAGGHLGANKPPSPLTEGSYVRVLIGEPIRTFLRTRMKLFQFKNLQVEPLSRVGAGSNPCQGWGIFRLAL